MYNMILEKRMISKILLIIIVWGCIRSSAYSYADEIIQSIIGTITNTDESILSYEVITTDFLNELPFKQMMIDLNGYMARNLNIRELYGGSVLSNGYVAGIFPQTTTDYEIKNILELKSFLDERGIQLLYVNEPTKYFDDNIIQEDIGKKSYVNANTDLFLSKLKDANINYIDLRDTFTRMGDNSFAFFYKTDHHWSVPAGKISAQEISTELNQVYGYHIDLTIYDDNKFTVTHFENAWLGEQGRKLGASFVGMEDYDLIVPNYNTDYTVLYGDGNIYSGTFGEVLVSQELYLPERNKDMYSARSWHYSYMSGGLNQSTVINNLCSEKKKILIVGDSFEQVTVPFLSLGVSEIHTLILRNYEGSLRDYIDDNDIDIVIIAYVASMIGEHDDEASANYKMFDFQ